MDDGVDLRFQGAQSGTVGARHVEVDARRTVGVHLGACHQSAVEVPEHQCVDDVQIAVKLCLASAECRIDHGLEPGRQNGLLDQLQPELPGHLPKADDRNRTVGPAELPAIRELAAAAGIKGRFRETDQCSALFDHTAVSRFRTVGLSWQK
ncbi:hypothetical protein ABWI00_00050 [Algihabitans albus]|uniref:hypothetical protein n=1 Tax=Algihabitans albus TaxID=2164067 RepID=UPI0035D0B6B6